ncbi:MULTISPECIES: DUF5822 domain-containing protein [Halorubrum]|uniref:DUF5822 domain-containing protein n=1 Tax=Halorubrum TaxID=56688 RepID=UPI0010F7FAEF|nr:MULTISPECIES: DUF5822 domain-containing protein [Halorubrum]MDB9251750.1 DUF5822 domain-containing protein [Halorubrum ezzemoulense]MDB9256159.1 DUF5822 domain-containing protein [Halorubrum ezzemoulense]MDB9276870.1 DUF5822 domain-containing protein [Halorubrum ezzemoulense]TKX38262.1 hypothetical protein EXE51_03205 [Halorubrum sp. CGM5_25_10-8B]
MQPVERAEYEGVDYAWVMQTTFVVTILVGAPAAALLSTLVTLETWGARAAFAVRIGAPIWFVTAVAVALYARRAEAGDGGSGSDADASAERDADADASAERDADADAGDAEPESTEPTDEQTDEGEKID